MKSATRGALALGSCLAVGSAACGAAGGSGAGGVIERDSAGIRIVESPAALLEVELKVAPEPEVTLGVMDGAPEYQLHQVSAAARLDDGTMVVVNGGSREIRFYRADGTHRATAGGGGQGPSEFRYPVAMLLRPPDTVQVQDRMDRVHFTMDGSFLGRVTTDMGALQEVVGVGAFAEGGLWLSDGSFFAPAYLREARQGSPVAGPPFRPPWLALRIAGDLSSSDTLGRFGGILQQFVDVGEARGAMPVVLPFGANSHYAHGPEGGSLVVADGASPEVHLFQGDGAHTIVRWAAAPEPVSAAEVEAWKEVQRGSAWAQSRLPQMERAWAAMDVPSTKAYHGALVAMGRDGSIWLLASADYGRDPAVFLVFDPEGRLRGNATLPGPFRVMDAGPDWVLGVWRDEYDVEYLRMYRFGA